MSEKREAYDGSVRVETAIGHGPQHYNKLPGILRPLSARERWEAEVNGKFAQIMARLDILDKKVFSEVPGELAAQTRVIQQQALDWARSLKKAEDQKSEIAAREQLLVQKVSQLETDLCTASEGARQMAATIADLRSQLELKTAYCQMIEATLELMKAAK